jgi:hypothetical protein
MFKKIAATVPAYDWAPDGSRFRKLDLFDRLLDGTFYDGLKHSFYDETEGMGQAAVPIPIDQRRPSTQYRLPRMVARWSSRKLFSGRHVPRIKHDDPKAKARVEALIVSTGLYRKMMEIAFRGSVGSVAATFRVETNPAADGKNEDVRCGVNVWKAKWCWPSFDTMGELSALRIAYLTWPAAFAAMNLPDLKPMEPNRQYWFIRDYLTNSEVTFQPVLKEDWDPCNGFKEGATEHELTPWDTHTHDFGFVPGHWFKNLAGGEDPDGACTWEDAIPDSIELDYVFSQVARGTRYNCAPQPVIIGNLMNPGDMTRGPAVALFLEPGRKDPEGNVINAGDAKLLEMTGKGIEAGLMVVDKLHDHALEQISAARKDPQRMKGVLSGRGMEFLDQDSHDLVMELRTAYGDEGLLPLLRKMCVAVYDGEIDAARIALQWPRLNQPEAADISSMADGISKLLNPLQAAYAPARPASSEKGPDGTTTPVPASEEQKPPEDFMLVTPDQAKLFVSTYLDLTTLELDGAAVAEVEEQSTADLPGEPIETAPAALGPEDQEVIEGEGEAQTDPVADAMQNVINRMGM